MINKNLDTQEQQNKWWAYQDARMRNIANASRFPETQKIRAERMKLALEMVYRARDIYINYRKTKIAVKVADGWVRDPKALRLLENDWAGQGVVKSTTAQGVIYSFG